MCVFSVSVNDGVRQEGTALLPLFGTNKLLPISPSVVPGGQRWFMMFSATGEIISADRILN